jgi:uroporphyrin-III C-methyltransferase/precorrin-2 dehydrogenase/sirohydrochlorin ferrochelatase
MNSLPISLSLDGRCCIIVGGGDVAARKVELLLRANAVVSVVAPKLCPRLEELRQLGRISHLSRKFKNHDVPGNFLVIAATNDLTTNRRVSEVSELNNIPVNVVDQPELCTFTMPSIVDRSPVTIAVSTGGASPVMARQLRARLETLIPTSYGRLADLVNDYRQEVKNRISDVRGRRRFWEDVLHGTVAHLFSVGKEAAAREALERAVKSMQPDKGQGEVYLVGAGPGDPDLLTFRALRLMQQADVVLYDRLVSKEILDLIRRDARKIYVGKERSNHALPQPEINERLAELAKGGNRVLRLKGGDPFIFGRGGEEIGELTRQGIPFQVVPGITAAAGCASYAGIPLTHRDFAQSCVFVTGHLKDGSVDLNWEQLAQPQQTVVIYMGLIGMPVICRELIAHGVDKDMPIALIEQGTTINQRVFIGTLASLPDSIKDKRVHAPTLFIIGDVVKLHDTLSWFDPSQKKSL